MKNLVKNAFFMGKVRAAYQSVKGSRAPIIAGTIIGTTVAAEAVDAIQAAVRRRGMVAKKKQYYIKMLETYPILKKQNPEHVARLFESLAHFAPNMAADPTAAGAFIKQTITRGYVAENIGPAPDMYAMLSDIQKKTTDASKVPVAALPSALTTYKSIMDLGKEKVPLVPGPDRTKYHRRYSPSMSSISR